MTENDYMFKLRNLGINDEVFEKFTCIKKDRIKKVCSEGAIVDLNIDRSLQIKRNREAEDIYSGVVNDLNPYEEESGSSSNSDYYSEEEGEEDKKDLPPNPPNNLQIFNNISQKQLGKLHDIVKEIHDEKKEILVKAYKSKLKSKYTHIYEENSKSTENRTKFKIFHKCNFPGCNRTFASAGWLGSHFEEHSREISCCKFNKIFDMMKKYF